MLQKTTLNKQGLGVVGTISRSGDQNVVLMRIVASAGIKVGNFVQTTAKVDEVQAIKPNTAVTGSVVGVALVSQLIDSSSDTDEMPLGYNMQVLNKGFVYIKTDDADAKQGKKVAIVKDSGALSFVDVVPETAIDTGFVVESGNSDLANTGTIEIYKG